MTSNWAPFGAAVKQARLAAKKSQGDVARYLDVTVTYVSDVENGKRTPYTRERLLKVAHFLSAPPGRLLIVRSMCTGTFELPTLGNSRADGLAAALSANWDKLTADQIARIGAALGAP